MLPLFGVSIFNAADGPETKWWQNLKMRFLKPPALTEPSDINQAHTVVVVTVAVMRGWQIHHSYDICRLEAFLLAAADTLQSGMTRHHHPDRPTSGCARRTLSQQIQLAFPRRQPFGMTHCNMMKLYTNASDSIWARWDAAAGSHASDALIWGWQLVPCVQAVSAFCQATKLRILLYTIGCIILHADVCLLLANTNIFMLTLLYWMLAKIWYDILLCTVWLSETFITALNQFISMHILSCRSF